MFITVLSRGLTSSASTDDAAIPPEPSTASPVTWHVILWILLSLSINSMAQPTSKFCGIPSRYRLYLASSPILCVADALSALIRLITLSIRLPIKPRQAFQLVVHARSDPINSEDKKPPESQTWPRYLFFILGTLPAAIKLSSFSGTPWTQVWGLMFATSFIVTELITLLGHPHPHPSSSDQPTSTSTVEAILALSTLQWETSTHAPIRTKTHSLFQTLSKLETTLFLTALLTHLGLQIWTIHTLWQPASRVLETAPLARGIVTWVTFAISLYLMLTSLAWLVASCFGLQGHVARFWTLAWKAEIAAALLPHPPSQNHGSGSGTGSTIPPPPGWVHRAGSAMAIWAYLVGMIWCGYWVLERVVGRWEAVGRVLLLDARGEEEERGVRVDENAYLCFWVFLGGLGSCGLWYAFLYEEVGTVNPSWTDVFG